MNNKYLLLFLLLPLLWLGCKEDGAKPILFEMTYRVDLEIPAGLNTIEDHYFQFKRINSLLDSLLSFHGFTREDISSVNPKTARLTAAFAGDEYNFIRELSLYLFVDEVNGRRSEAFWRPEIPLNTGEILDVPGTLIDGKDYFFEPRFNIELRLDTRDFTNTFIETRLDFTFVIRGN